MHPQDERIAVVDYRDVRSGQGSTTIRFDYGSADLLCSKRYGGARPQ
jgi:hypothetical protein